jgi:enoyl-CoA hydratase/carnithine racemase
VFFTQEHIASLHERIHRCPKPVIAAVNGPAMGGGFSLALACDVRFASTSASFGARFIKMGVSACDMGTSYFLPRLVGASRAAELMLTGRIFAAAEAREMGLVLDVVPDGQVVARALETARAIRENPPLATWMTKETLWQNVDAPSLRHALDLENRTQVMCSHTGELREACSSRSVRRAGRSCERDRLRLPDGRCARGRAGPDSLLAPGSWSRRAGRATSAPERAPGAGRSGARSR